MSSVRLTSMRWVPSLLRTRTSCDRDNENENENENACREKQS